MGLIILAMPEDLRILIYFVWHRNDLTKCYLTLLPFENLTVERKLFII